MAVTDIVDYVGQPVTLEMSRGDIGTVDDICDSGYVSTELTLVAGNAVSGDYVYTS